MYWEHFQGKSNTFDFRRKDNQNGETSKKKLKGKVKRCKSLQSASRQRRTKAPWCPGHVMSWSHMSWCHLRARYCSHSEPELLPELQHQVLLLASWFRKPKGHTESCNCGWGAIALATVEKAHVHQIGKQLENTCLPPLPPPKKNPAPKADTASHPWADTSLHQGYLKQPRLSNNVYL